jgi:hypothetical protein
MTEEGQEDGYGDSNGLTRCSPMPGKGSCSNPEKDQKIPQLISGLPHLNSHNEWTPQTGALRDAGGAIGEVKLGIKKKDVGMHLIRSGAAMATYLGECPVFMIMLIGCWSSNAFLRYIRKQVMEFSKNVTKRMLSCQNFRHIPDIHTRIQQDNPHIRNHPDNAKMRRNVGGNLHRCIRLPPFLRFN